MRSISGSVKPNKKYSAISLFSGAGGLDLGFESTGRVSVVETHDANETFVRTLQLNRGKKVNQDFEPVLNETRINHSDLADPNVLRCFLDKKGSIDIVYGGPPCQSFSVAGKRLGLQDLRGSLIYSFIEIIDNVMPRGFVFENVPGFTTIHNGELRYSFLKKIRELGYSTWDGILNAADFGSATFRERFFVVAVKGGKPIKPPSPTHVDPSTVNEGQDDLFGLELRSWQSCEQPLEQVRLEALASILPNHVFVNHKPETIERFSHLKFGERDQIRRRNRLDPARPSYTIFVGGVLGKLQARTHIHPFEDRELTPRECAALHGFPNDWEFCGNLDEALLQVANSVPIPLASKVASHLLEALDGED